MASDNNENFYKRLKVISGIEPDNKSLNEANSRTLIDFERANNGTVYGVVKENHQYFIKKALIKEGDVKVTDFTYIDGVENKRKYQYKTVAEAAKQRNFYLRGINEAFDQGGVYFVNETTQTESPKLETKEDFSALVRKTIDAGKKNITEGREKKFKSTLPEAKEATNTVRRGLMPEAADVAVKRALGLLSEESMITADSEIKDGDIVSDKKGKEEPQAPINDKNAKAKAEKATGKSKKDANKKPDAPNSLAVNQEDAVLKEEVSPLVNDDSEINPSDNVADKVSQKHEPAQAPINDTNAKAEADKATGSGSASAAISNNVDDSPESDPFDDKENAGDETGDIVTEDADKGDPFDDKAKLSTSGDIVAADSDEKDGDRVDDETKHEAPQAEYNSYNQPEKGQKEEKGEALKPVASEKDIVAEAEALVTADSEIEAASALANLTKTNLPDAIAEGDAKENDDSNPFDKKEDAGDEKDDIVAEGADLITADSEIDADSSLANSKSNLSFDKGKVVQGTSYAMNDNAIAEGIDEAGEEEIDAAASALDGLEAATDAEEAAPEVAPEMGGDEVGVDAELPADGGEEVAADGGEAGGGSADLVVQEIEKLVGKTTQKIRNADLEPETAEGFLKSIVSSFEDKLPQMDIEDRKEVSDKILKADSKSLEGGEEEVAVDAEVPVDGGEEPAGDFDSVEAPVGGEEVGGEEVAAEEIPLEEPAVEEDAPMSINGEEGGDEIPDGGGSFESYMKSRGYSPDNLEECSSSEMGSIVSGYVTDKDGEMSEDEIKNIASYMDDNVATELEEYGHGDFAEKARPYMSEDGVSFGMVEPMLSPIEMEEDEIEDEIEAGLESDEAPEGEIADAGFEDALDGGEEGGEESVVSIGEPADAPEEEAPKPEMGFAPMGDVLGGGVLKPDGAKTKTVEVDINAGTLKLQVSEGNSKVRDYVKNRISELAGKKKPSINENSKSDNLKKLDKLIEQQWKLYGDKMLKM